MLSWEGWTTRQGIPAPREGLLQGEQLGDNQFRIIPAAELAILGENLFLGRKKAALLRLGELDHRAVPFGEDAIHL